MYLTSTISRYRNLALAAVLLLLAITGFSQKSREQLEKERKANLAKIEEAQKILKETEGRKSNTLGQLNALNQQMSVRRDLISSMQSELTLIEKDLGETDILISSLQSDLDSLKDEYGAMVYSAYKARTENNMIMFLLASSSFNQMIRRIQYLDQYSSARNNQIREINMVTQVLEMEIEGLQMQTSRRSAGRTTGVGGDTKEAAISNCPAQPKSQGPAQRHHKKERCQQ